MKQREIWNAIAPEWRRLRNKAQPDIADFISGSKGLILDVGCGSGRHFLKGKDYAAFDFSEKQVLLAKEKAKSQKISALLAVTSADAMPFKDNVFDTVVAANVIHQIEGEEPRKKAVTEMRRVMKPGASAIVSVWNKDQPRFLFKKKENYVSWKIGNEKYLRYNYTFTKAELKKLLEKAGFSVLKIYGSKHKVFGIFSSDIVAVIQKP